jgi:beta-mannosidase
MPTLCHARYGANRPGQVLGGRWKPLHYLLKASVFADVTGSCCLKCATNANCYVKNDGAKAFSGIVTIEFVSLDEGATSKIALNQTVALGPGAGAIQWLSVGQMPVVNTSVAVRDDT